MSANYVIILAFGIGIVAGLRALTAPAVVAWAAHLGWLNVHNTHLVFMASMWAAILFSILAIFELIGDLLPWTPNRTAPPSLAARLLLGGLCGACLSAAASHLVSTGAVLGAIGALIGAFAGYEIRKRLTVGLNIKDIFIAIPEDFIAIGLAFFVVWPFS